MTSATPPTLSSERPRWTRRKEARHGELLEAALDLFVERGFAATRADDVAARAGVSKGTMYLYFANKEDLFQAVVREAIVPQISEVYERVRSYEGHSGDLLRELMFSWWDKFGGTKSGGIIKLVMSEAGNFPDLARFFYDEVIQPAHQLFQLMLQRGIDRREFRPVDIVMTTQALTAPLVMLVMWKQSIGPCATQPLPDPKNYIEHVINITLHGLLIETGDAL